MIEIRLHGRGGQGTVVASKILADAIVMGGGYVQAFPEFGVERRGAPVVAYVRLDNKPINLKSKIYQPDHIVVLDPTLLQSVNVTDGLKEGGKVLVNSEKEPSEMQEKFGKSFKVMTVDATAIALEKRLGSKTSPIVNTAILGAIVKALNVTNMDLIIKAIEEGVPLKVEENVEAAKKAYTSLKGGE